MKRYVLVAFSIVFLCGLLMQIALVSAYRSGYETINYQAISEPTEDGKWTTTTEWTDAMTPPNLPASFQFREKWTWPTPSIIEHFLIEFFTDSTNDTADYVQLCFDNTANGGSAPQTDDILVNYTGNSRSGLTLYRGTGTGWAPTSYAYGSDILIAETKTGSQLNSNPHWIIEVMMDRSAGTLFDVSGAVPAYSPWIRVAVFDASSTSGVQAWPPTSRDVPNDWGLETGTTSNIPEGLTITTVVLLSSVAVGVSVYFLRKRQKAESNSAGKLGEINYTR